MANMAVPRRSAGVLAQGTGYADVSELDRYKLVGNIGKGSFGVISKVHRLEDGKEFALKQLDYSKMTEKDRKQILAEVAILESLKHRNIVQLVQKIKDPQNERIYIVMEYCTSGDLSTLIRKAQRTGQPLHEDKIWNIFLQITLALHHCHVPNERSIPGQKAGISRLSGPASQAEGSLSRYQVLHRDLKPENVFLSDEFVKLGDFGLSKDMGNAAFTSTYVGTPLYMPPEILAENRYDTKSDIWSLGCLVYEMCTLSSPFATAQTQAELIAMVKSGKLPPFPVHISPMLKQVVRAMLTLNPIKRPSTKDLLDMDEMKLHRKLFTVQNQTSLLLAKKDELRQLEERLAARCASLDKREQTLFALESQISQREAQCAAQKEDNAETQRKLNHAAEALRGQWERFRGEKEREKEPVGLGLPVMGDDRSLRRPSIAPIRPPLEERNTVPLAAVPRFPRPLHAAYEDTPSKIPLAAAIVSPAPLERSTPMRNVTPLRRNATKSLGNIAQEYRTQSERDAEWATLDATPAKQTIPSLGRHQERQRSSIGSPGEVHGRYCEDITMASPAISVASPFFPRPRRSSVARNFLLSQQQSVSALPSSESASSTDSMASAATSSSATSASSDSSKTATFPPTMIPAPTYIYREVATPAKWLAEDPDLPSPFLRRGPATASAPLPIIGVPASLVSHSDRQPLGAINVQSSAATSSDPPFPIIPNKPRPMPRSKSGGLHQQVLRTNAQAMVEAKAGRTGTEGTSGSARARALAGGRELGRVPGI